MKPVRIVHAFVRDCRQMFLQLKERAHPVCSTTDRYADAPKVAEIIQGIKGALKDVPNVDLLSPFRVHLVDFAESGLKINVVCYFATKSFDEFLYLQQVALLEITRVVQNASATMTSVLYVDMNNPAPIGSMALKGVMKPSSPNGASQSGLPPSVIAPQVSAHEADGSAVEEQNGVRQINGTSGANSSKKVKNSKPSKASRSKSGKGVKAPRGGNV